MCLENGVILVGAGGLCRGQTAERSERKMNDYIRICEVEKYYGNRKAPKLNHSLPNRDRISTLR